VAHARVLTGRRRALAALAAVLIVVTATNTTAYAAPTVADLEAQINQEWNTLEPLVEQYNELHTTLQANQAKVAALQTQIKPLKLQVDLVQARVGAMSANLYETGPLSNLSAILESGSPANLMEQLSTLEAMTRRQTDTVQGAADLMAKYDTQKQPLDALVAVETQQDAQLAAQTTTIQQQMNSLQVLRQQAYGASGMSGGAIRPVACPFVLGTGKGAIAAKVACDQIGKPYVWATAGPRTFDCSGLTLYAWAAAGVTLRHFTQWQWDDSKPVSRAQLQPGDLVFYFSDHHHMSMYVGGNWVVHAPTSGDVVRMTQLDNPYLPIAGFRRPG
jgi:cell wall-associated NlpC family hydrolase